MKQYYIEDGKIRSITNKVTSKYIYSKTNVWCNNIGTVYKTKESAIKAYIRTLKGQLIDIVEKKLELDENIKRINQIIKKQESML